MSIDILLIMENFKAIVLFDIDHTLFNTSLYQKLCYERISEKVGYPDKDKLLKTCQEVYKEQRSVGPFRRKEFIDTLCERLSLTENREELVSVFSDGDIIDKAVYKDAEEVILELTSKDILIGIFSAGPRALQSAKVRSLLQHFSEEHIYIHEVDKKQDIPLIVNTYKNYHIFVIDDLRDVLYSLKTAEPEITTILIKREDWTDRAKITPSDFRPDREASNLKEVLSVLN